MTGAPRIERVQLNGADIEYDVRGSGEPVVFIHCRSHEERAARVSRPAQGNLTGIEKTEIPLARIIHDSQTRSWDSLRGLDQGTGHLASIRSQKSQRINDGTG